MVDAEALLWGEFSRLSWERISCRARIRWIEGETIHVDYGWEMFDMFRLFRDKCIEDIHLDMNVVPLSIMELEKISQLLSSYRLDADEGPNQ